MNRFDELFFSKYVSEWTKIVNILHRHIIVILDKIILTYFFGAIIPSFLYYFSNTIKALIPFFVLEAFLIWIFIKWIYDILNWYNDVWIITDDWVIDLEWQLFSSNSVTLKFTSIEWLEYIEKWILDAILWKWDIIINKIWWWDEFVLENAANALKNLEMIDNKLKNNKKKPPAIIHKKEEPKIEEPIEQNFDTVIKALSWVVESYLKENWYKVDNSEEKKAYIKEIKKKWGAIDLTKQKKKDNHWHDDHWSDNNEHDEHWQDTHNIHDSHWHDEHWHH